MNTTAARALCTAMLGLAACSPTPDDLAREAAELRGDCTVEGLRAADDACVEAFGRGTERLEQAMEVYAGALRTLQRLADERGIALDTTFGFRLPDIAESYDQAGRPRAADDLRDDPWRDRREPDRSGDAYGRRPGGTDYRDPPYGEPYGSYDFGRSGYGPEPDYRRPDYGRTGAPGDYDRRDYGAPGAAGRPDASADPREAPPSSYQALADRRAAAWEEMLARRGGGAAPPAGRDLPPAARDFPDRDRYLGPDRYAPPGGYLPPDRYDPSGRYAPPERYGAPGRYSDWGPDPRQVPPDMWSGVAPRAGEGPDCRRLEAELRHSLAGAAPIDIQRVATTVRLLEAWCTGVRRGP